MPSQTNIEQVARLKELLSDASAVFVSEYRSLTVSQMTEVRAKLREAGGEMKVAKNTLMRIAMKEVGLPVVEDMTAGPNVYTVAHGDPVTVAKALLEFSRQKGNEALSIKGGVLGKKVLSAAEVEALSALPPREVLLGQLLGAIGSPLYGLVNVLSGSARMLVTCLDQIKMQKEKATTA